jgi:hypothetical protein
MPASFLPDELAEVDHGLHLIEADSEGVGHGPEPGRIDDDITVFERRPLGWLHTGRLSGLLNRTGGELPNILDHGAEQPAPGAVEDVGGSGGRKRVITYTYILIAHILINS